MNEENKKEFDKEHFLTEDGQPNWEPLEKLFPMWFVGGFMHMGAYKIDDDLVIEQYKHRLTRRTLFIDKECNFYKNYEGKEKINRRDAIGNTFYDWMCMLFVENDDKLDSIDDYDMKIAELVHIELDLDSSGNEFICEDCSQKT